MLSQDVVASATVRYLGTSAQKARLVVDLIRGRDVGEAAATLRYTRKAVAVDIGRLLDSAVANARQKGEGVDVDRLYVRTAFVDGGPTLKRIQPAPMGRAFRILKRMCHVTIGLGERKAHEPAQPTRAHEGAEEKKAGRKAGGARARTRRTTGRKAGAAAARGRRAGTGRKKKS
ncbi:MAG TPA: 50S ribosomal protein L22 [Candidatus Polarisedimenticolia bacterium]|nr:50S ribosomal protein L22 [Candidatus Polarisedimenticolia bacterium]